MTILQKLTEWQKEQARIEGLEGYMVLPFKTLQEIAQTLPSDEVELLAVKGVGPIKVKKYGQTILNIVLGKEVEQNNFSQGIQELAGDSFDEANAINDLLGTDGNDEIENNFFAGKINLESETVIENENIIENGVEDFKNKIDLETGEILNSENDAVSVSEALDICNVTLVQNRLRVQGEVTRVDSRERVIYFTLKDSDDGSVVSALIFRNNYELSGVVLKEGTEIIVEAVAEIYKPTGRLSLKVSSIELAGEGALKKAYDDLKKKLEKEGLLSAERKREVQKLPQKIGLITSRDGAAIGDFMTNLGSYGFKISFCHSSVEGQKAVSEILSALKTMSKKDLDLLVIVRGGGSLESLQAFNNERIVREVANFSVPVIAGIGHEQDETLTTLVADGGVSTPTAAARIVRESWDLVKKNISQQESFLLNSFENILLDVKNNLQDGSEILKGFFENVNDDFESKVDRLENHFESLGFQMKEIQNKVNFSEKFLRQNNPERQLKLGYSIARDENGAVVRSVEDVSEGDIIDVQVSDGNIDLEVLSVKK